MPIPTPRPSLTTNLVDRYNSQPVGEAFNVQKTLADSNLVSGDTIDATSMQGANFQSPDGFEVKVQPQQTQFLDAQGNTSKQLSVYLKGFSNQPYDP